jgi:putative DNA primase/helicase
VAFNCGNLEAVAKALRTNNPDRAIVVCGDDDRHTQGNPGRTHAERAAAAVGGSVAFPVFTDRNSTGTDFNDLHQTEGAEAVRRLVAVPKAPRQPAPLVTKASDFRPEPIRWIWEGWLAAGKVHICAGPPGTGKTSVAMALAATITQGGRWPDNTWAAPADVVVWSGEDDPTDTLVPRLMAAGADLERVHIVSGYQDEDGERRAFDPGRDARALADHIGRMDPAPALLIVDPIVSAVSGDSHKNAEVRRALQPLVDLGMTQRCAVLGVTHFSKGSSGRDPVERVTGSLAFGALARVVMVAAKRPDEEGGGRLLARGKSNIGPDSGGFGYDLEVCTVGDGIQTTRVLWREALQGSARELLSQAETQDDPEERNGIRRC